MSVFLYALRGDARPGYISWGGVGVGWGGVVVGWAGVGWGGWLAWVGLGSVAVWVAGWSAGRVAGLCADFF